MIQLNETLKVGDAARLFRPLAVGAALFAILLPSTAATAQQGRDSVTETVTTQRDLNGKDLVSE